jgi:hypothetical protein
MDSDLANIALICVIMGVGIALSLVVIFVYLLICELIETCYLKD